LGGADNGRAAAGGARVGGACTIWFPDGAFLCDSRGRTVNHPAFYQRQIATLRRLSRSLSRKLEARKHRTAAERERIAALPRWQRDRNIFKARRRLARWHEHVAAKRTDFLWRLAREYAERFDAVTLYTRPAKTPIQYAITSNTALRLCDAAYGRFETMLRQKCQQFGTELTIKENPTWPQQKETLRQARQWQDLGKALRTAKSALKKGSHKRLQSSLRDCARAVTREI